ncbi:MAG: 2,3-bisphosphoglycerate-independent phosphoglycerate mutase [Candidatus Bathyarchaeota archaeon]|nr:2,3-bisphosphoglycerate-independent phosphoglycerate mutase [Candidatus Bathyarchaeota archaeon]
MDKPELGIGNTRPLVLVILDGWGLQEKTVGNAIAAANLPNFQRIWRRYPHTTLNASGDAVGLPEGVMGNSEVGHLNLGAGRLILQDLVRINKAIQTSEFMHNPTLLSHLKAARDAGRSIHFMGLLSDGGVHSDISHLFALLRLAKTLGCEKVWVHCFLDGRDTPPKIAEKYLDELQKMMDALSVGKIATVIGRYYAMDRDNRWDRTAKAYYAITQAEGLKASSAEAALSGAYLRGEGDEFVQPTVIEGYGGFGEGDRVVFYNFRSDRPRQLVRSLYQPGFDFFDRKVFFHPDVVCMTQYDKEFHLPTVFPPLQIKNGLGEYLSSRGLRQFRIAETEKYAHVTFFFNGGVEKPYPGEDRVLVKSPKVATYNLKPQMSAEEVTAILVEKITAQLYDFVLVNYANPDMVSHTADWKATIAALETIDECLGKVLAATARAGGLCIVTSDHGHAEQLIDPDTGGPWTAHTCNPVPFIVVTDAPLKLRQGQLGDVAPTVLELMGIAQPSEMTGRSLIEKTV